MVNSNSEMVANRFIYIYIDLFLAQDMCIHMYICIWIDSEAKIVAV